MKKLLLLVALSLLATVAPLRAEVLIYEGPVAVSSSPGIAAFPPVIRTFYVFDLGTKEAGSIVYFKLNGQKSQFGGITASAHFTTSTLAGGETARLISQGVPSSQSPPSFLDGLTYFRGTQKSLNVADGTSRNEPRTLKGIQYLASENSGNGSFFEGRVKLTYDERRTIDANNAGRTAQGALNDIHDALAAKGFL